LDLHQATPHQVELREILREILLAQAAIRIQRDRRYPHGDLRAAHRVSPVARTTIWLPANERDAARA
jgi:hypothetical protein